MSNITAETLIEQLNKLDNSEKNIFLDKIYSAYFDKGIPFDVLTEHARILEMFYNGELVESPEEYHY